MASWLQEWIYGADGPAVMADLETFAAAGDMANFKSAMRRWGLVRNMEWTSLSFDESLSLHTRLRNEKLVVLHRVLDIAIEAGQLSIVKYLIESCGCIIIEAIHVALHSEQWDIMELFFKKGWDIDRYVNEGNSYSLLGYARESEAQTLWLLQHGANPNLRTLGGNREIPSIFAQYATLSCLKLLRQYGADFTKSDALHCAAKGAAPDRLEVMAYLLDEVGYPIDQLELEAFPDDHRAWGGGTAVHVAVRADCEETLRFLLENRADRDKPDSEGRTPIELAREIGSEAGVRLLQVK